MGYARAPDVANLNAGAARYDDSWNPLALATATDEERRTAHWHLHGLLVHASLDDRNRAMRMLREWTSDGTPRVRPLVADEVRSWRGFPASPLALTPSTIWRFRITRGPGSRK